METKPQFTATIEVALKAIAEILQNHIDLLSVYCFGIQSSSEINYNMRLGQRGKHEQRDHFYLFICVEKIPNNATANLMDIIKMETKGKYTCTLLLHTFKQIATAKPDQKHFYKDILEKAWLIAGDALDVEKIKLTNLSEKNKKAIHKYVKDRRMIAHSLLLEPTEGDETLLVAVTVHCVLEQLFLAGIYEHLQYRPNHFHLKYLYELFQFCCPTPDYIFPASFFEQGQFREILNTNHNDLRFRSRNIFEKEDVQCMRLFARYLYLYS